MIFSMKRTIAILQKDYKDLSKNMFVASSVFMPLVLAAVYGRAGVKEISGHYMIINLTLCLVAAYVQCSLIAEEKEKNTLRGLMLSPVNTMEILAGKSLLSFIGTIIVIIAGAFLTEYKPANLFTVSIAIALSTVFYIGLGTVLGLVTKSVMEASVVILPFMGIFTFGSALGVFADKYPILKAAEFLPNTQLIELAAQDELGASFIDIGLNLAVILAWVVAIYIVAVIIYRKRMMD
ncbi:ABC transporter permease [Bacillus sp. S/N-304-OC-R1]|uniref:ABC transporter permease n=1 Tax=Bacillus sp. S/N-304-OC-R1 TaxID=2758034 RepID=UPI001C8E0690|nr:ABC transporter permease [Bacillus sp. S/N-304-OC-R1]MBY0122213.1 ABC transporter permease [Bacillus sp. S/N-304-OC-R1]